MKTTEVKSEEQLREMIEQSRKDLEPLVMEQSDEAKTDRQKRLQLKHGTPRDFARKTVAAIGEISIDEAEVAIALYRKLWEIEIVQQQHVSMKSRLFREAIRRIEAQLSDGMASALDEGMHRDVMLESSFVFGKIAFNCNRNAEKLRAAIQPCGVKDCRCHVLQNRLLDAMIDVAKIVEEETKS